MRTLPVVYLVIAIGVAALMWNLSGVDDALSGPSPADDLESGDELEAQRPGQPDVNGSADSSDGEGDIVGLVISGAQDIGGIGGLVMLLPDELMALGFPSWFAVPIGLLAEFIATIGLVQFVTNRVWR